MSNQVDQAEMSSIKGYGLFQYFESNAYRGEYLSAFDLKQAHFDLFSRLANQVIGFSIKRPNNLDSIEEISNLVVNIIEKELN